MTPSTERDPAKQLVTAKILLAMFEAQLTEYDNMSDHDREHTERGQDLTARLPGLRQGHTQWAERTRLLQDHIAQTTPHTP
jgi:FtsZ-binding cell division protein ZapB